MPLTAFFISEPSSPYHPSDASKEGVISNGLPMHIESERVGDGASSSIHVQEMALPQPVCSRPINVVEAAMEFPQLNVAESGPACELTAIYQNSIFTILPPELWWEIAKFAIVFKYHRNWHGKVQKYPVGRLEQPCPAPAIVSMIIRRQFTHFGKLVKIPAPRPWTLCVDCLLWAAPVNCDPPIGDYTWSGDPNGSWLIHYEILMRFAYVRDYAGFEGKKGRPPWHKRVEAYYYARNTLFNPVLAIWDSEGGNLEEFKKQPKPLMVNPAPCSHPYAGAVSGYSHMIP